MATGNFKWDPDVEKYTPEYIQQLDYFGSTGYAFCVSLKYPDHLRLFLCEVTLEVDVQLK